MCDGKAINHNEHVALTEFHNQQSSFQNSSITKRRRSGARKTQPECNCSDANLRHFYTLHTHSHDTDCQCFNWMIWFERRRRQPIPILPLRLCLWYGRQYFWLVNGCWSFPNHIYMNVFTAVRMSIDAIGFRKLFLLRYSCSYWLVLLCATATVDRQVTERNIQTYFEVCSFVFIALNLPGRVWSKRWICTKNAEYWIPSDSSLIERILPSEL